MNLNKYQLKYTQKMKKNLIAQGHTPAYITKRGKLLFIDNSRYDKYSSVTGAKILVGVDGRFWGYSDDEKISRRFR